MNNKKRQSIAIGLLIINLLFSWVAQATSPLAGTLIQNQATATYKDASGTEQMATSNVVATLIQQVATMELVQDQTRIGVAGNTVYLPHVLTNTGNGDDTYDLAATDLSGDDYDLDNLLIYADANQDGIPDDSTPITSTGLLSAEEAFYFVVAASIPETVTDAQQALVSVKGTSTFDSSQQQTNTDTVIVTDKAVIEVTKSMSANTGVSPSGAYTITLSYKNTGAQDAQNVRLVDILPAGMSYFADGVNNHALWSEGSVILTDEGEEAQAGIVYCAYDNTCTHTNQVTATLSTVAAGDKGFVSFQVIIDAGLDAQTLMNIANFEYNNGSVAIPPANTNQVPFEVVEQPGVVANGSINSNVDGTDEAVTVTSVSQGATVRFDNIIWNTGNSADAFDIRIEDAAATFPAGTVFQLYKSDGFTPLLDTNASGLVDTGLIAPGQYYKVVLKAILPMNASGDNGGNGFDVTKTAISSIDSSISNPVIDHLDQIAIDSVDITNNAPVGQANVLGAGAGPGANPLVTETVAPGDNAVFNLFVNNTSNHSRSYQLQFSHTNFSAGQIDANWRVSFHQDGGSNDCSTLGRVISSTSNIAAGSYQQVCAVVTVPADATADGGQLHPVYFRAYSSITGASDIKQDAVLISALPVLSIEPDQSGQVQPGNSVVYSHHVSNNGNTPLECVNVSVNNSQAVQGWSATLFKDVNNNGQLDGADVELTDQMLAPGESFPLLIKIFSPANAPMGISNMTDLVVTGNQEDGDGDATTCTGVASTDSSKDVTTVNTSEVSILKQQAPDYDCDGTTDGAYVTSPFQIDPGSCIVYQLTATNAGATAVNNVHIDDATPAFTLFYHAGSLPEVSQGLIQGGADGTEGTITGGSVGGTSVTLSPGESMIMTFGVRLD